AVLVASEKVSGVVPEIPGQLPRRLGVAPVADRRRERLHGTGQELTRLTDWHWPVVLVGEHHLPAGVHASHGVQRVVEVSGRAQRKADVGESVTLRHAYPEP